MTALAFYRWNGRIHASLEHGPARRMSERLGKEALRIELSPVEAATPLDMLARKYRRLVQEAA